MRLELDDDPAVLAIAAELGIEDVDLLIGKLWRFWKFASQQANPRGVIKGITLDVIDARIRCAGFARALLNARWLVAENCNVRIPNFNRWFTQATKTRLLTARRVSRHRDRKKRYTSVTESLPEEKRGEEKRREENTPPPPTPASGESGGGGGGGGSGDPVAGLLEKTFAGFSGGACPHDADDANGPDFSGLCDSEIQELTNEWLGHAHWGGTQMQFLGSLVQDFGRPAVIEGIKICIEQGGKTLAYLRKVCANGSRRRPSQKPGVPVEEAEQQARREKIAKALERMPKVKL